MHHKRKQAAEKLIDTLQGDGKLPEDITAALLEAKYTADELLEIAGGIYAVNITDADTVIATEEQTNTAKTEIIADNSTLIRTSSGRANPNSVVDDEIVILLTPHGTRNPMYGKAAKKFLSKNNGYSIEDKNGKGK